MKHQRPLLDRLVEGGIIAKRLLLIWKLCVLEKPRHTDSDYGWCQEMEVVVHCAHGIVAASVV
jgi:hypothetical protein